MGPRGRTGRDRGPVAASDPGSFLGRTPSPETPALGPQGTHGAQGHHHVDGACAHRRVLDVVLLHPRAPVDLVCVVVDLEGKPRGWWGRPGPSPDAPRCPRPPATPPTAFTPDSCWPAMRMMMETTCHRRDLSLNSFITEMKPAAFSASSSCRISSISASTSSQPRSLCSAEGRGRGCLRLGRRFPGQRLRDAGPAPPPTGQPSLTFPGSWLVFLLNQQVPGALGEEGQQQELRDGRDPGHGEEDGPGCEDTSVPREGSCNAARHRGRPPQPRVLPLPAPAPTAPSWPPGPMALPGAATQALREQGLGLSHSPRPQPLGWRRMQTQNGQRLGASAHLPGGQMKNSDTPKCWRECEQTGSLHTLVVWMCGIFRGQSGRSWWCWTPSPLRPSSPAQARARATRPPGYSGQSSPDHRVKPGPVQVLWW